MTWPIWLLLTLCALVLTWLGLSAVGSRRWSAMVTTLTRQLETTPTVHAAQQRSATRYDASELHDLPAPVQRYFRTVLQDGQALIRGVTIQMAGTMNMSASSQQWKALTARQRVVTGRAGFLWDARIAVLPGLPVHVVDSYIGGQGLLRASACGLFTVAELGGGGDIATGEFMRYVAEAPWYPTALLPSQGVQWQAVNGTSANATVTDGALSLTLLFCFNDAGLIASVRAQARGAMVGKTLVMTPWEGAWSRYELHDGMTVPMVGEAAWLRPEGRQTYFRGTVTLLRYDFAP